MKRPTALRLGVVAPLLVAGLFASTAARTPLVLQNVTPSLPLGLYIRSPAPIRLGTVVAVRQPKSAQAYLRGLGWPPDALLLKHVSATAGAMACSDAHALVVAGVPPLARWTRDRLGHPLPAWTGCHRLAADELIVAGDTATSFDSRYFGPVRRRDVVGVYAALR